MSFPASRIHTRDEWGARGRDDVFVTLGKAQVDTLVHHYSSMDAERRKNHSGCDDVVRNVEAYHMRHNGWAGIAYSHLYCQHGHVYEGRGWFKMTAATLGHNSHTQAVCFLGPDAKKRDDVTVPGREAATFLTNEFLRLFGKSKKVGGHRQFVNTSCPGDEIMAWIAAKGWLVDRPTEKPWPLPVPKWFWTWAKWQRERMIYSRREWQARRPKSAPTRVPDWAWVRLAAMTPKS